MGGKVITLGRESWRGDWLPASAAGAARQLVKAEPVAVSSRT